MNSNDEIARLKDLTGLETEKEVMEYVLFYCNAFPLYLVEYCEKMLEEKYDEISKA